MLHSDSASVGYADWWNPILAEPLRIEKGIAIVSDDAGTGVDWDEARCTVSQHNSSLLASIRRRSSHWRNSPLKPMLSATWKVDMTLHSICLPLFPARWQADRILANVIEGRPALSQLASLALQWCRVDVFTLSEYQGSRTVQQSLLMALGLAASAWFQGWLDISFCKASLKPSIGVWLTSISPRRGRSRSRTM